MSFFSKYNLLREKLVQYLERCKSISEEIGDHTTGNLVEGFMNNMNDIRFNVTIVGSFNRGKSTLLNTLMERTNDDISPISASVCTSAIIKYMDKNVPVNADGKEKGIIYYKPETGKKPDTVPLARIPDFVTEKSNPQNGKKVSLVEVYGDFPQWSKAVTIIDTPGQNSVFEHHDALLTDFLPSADAIIFLIAADLPGDGGDLELLKKLSENDQRKIFFVLTKVDSIDKDDELPEVIQYVTNIIQENGLTCDKLYQVSAKPVYDALKNGISGEELDNCKSANGILELEKDLEDFVVSESRKTCTIRARIEYLIAKTAAAYNGYVTATEGVLQSKEYDIASLQNEENSLNEANKTLRQKLDEALKDFGRDWDKTLSRFKMKFALKADEIDDKINDKLSKEGFIVTLFQAFKLKQMVQSAVNMELQPLTTELEEKLEALTQKLNNDMEIILTAHSQKLQDKASAVGAFVAGGTMGTVVTVSTVVSQNAFTGFMASLHTWQAASAAATSAELASKVSVVGAAPSFWGWLTGSGPAAAAATNVATAQAAATGAATTAIMAGTTALLTAGASIVVTLLVQKILHLGLVAFQKGRVPKLTQEIMTEMENSLLKSLELYKDNIIKEYRKAIEARISDNTDRLGEIKTLLACDNPDERKRLEDHLEKVKALLTEGTDVKNQTLLLGE